MLSIFQAARSAPQSLAIIDQHRQLDFQELAALTSAQLDALQSLKIGRSTPVALVADNRLDTLVLLLALLESRRPALLLHPRLTDRERQQLIEQAGAVQLCVSPKGWEIGSLSAGEEWPLAQACPAVLIATSGSSGSAKLVRLSSQSLCASAQASATHLGWRDHDRWLLCLSLAHVGGLSILTRCLLARRTLVLAEPNLAPEEMLARLIDHRVTLLSVVPTQLERLLSCRIDHPLALRAVLLGGARASANLVATARKRSIPALITYGMTETASQVATQPLADIELLPDISTTNDQHHAFRAWQLDSGIPLPGVQIRSDQDGIIHVRGPMLFDGYWSRLNPLADTGRDAQGWFCTGDVGYLDDEGRVHLAGRRDDRLTTGGEKVAPAEVEAVLEACPGVRKACVFGIADDLWGEIVAAAVVVDPAHFQSPAALAAHAAQYLASYKRPRRLACLPSLVLGATGKVDRQATARAAASVLVPV